MSGPEQTLLVTGASSWAPNHSYGLEALLHTRWAVAKMPDAPDDSPGSPPAKRMVGNDLLIVLSVLDFPKTWDLVLRIDRDGDMFAALNLPSKTPDAR